MSCTGEPPGAGRSCARQLFPWELSYLLHDLRGFRWLDVIRPHHVREIHSVRDSHNPAALWVRNAVAMILRLRWYSGKSALPQEGAFSPPGLGVNVSLMRRPDVMAVENARERSEASTVRRAGLGRDCYARLVHFRIGVCWFYCEHF
jgi:hypothetical protein